MIIASLIAEAHTVGDALYLLVETLGGIAVVWIIFGRSS